MQLKVGDKFHSLEILHYCGGGAYGDVYYCKDVSDQRMALKIISKTRLGEDWRRELHGVKNYRKITEKAPELLQIFHVEDNEDYFFYTMEAADSTSDLQYTPDTLANRLKKGPIPDQEVYPMLAQILTGIKIIHDTGFTHRDIKPDNIIFVKGIPKLSDIGLMSSLSATMSLLAGTLDFLPPELRAADSSESTDRQSRKRSDIYAFGKVIYCAVTGLTTRSFPSLPPELTKKMHLRHLVNLAFRLCDKSPDYRIDSLEELQKKFQAIKTKMEHGESRLDRIRDTLAAPLQRFKGTFRYLHRHWTVLAAVLLVIPAIVWWGVKMLLAKNKPAAPDVTLSSAGKEENQDIPATASPVLEESTKETVDSTIVTIESAPHHPVPPAGRPASPIKITDLEIPKAPEVKLPEIVTEIVEVPYQDYDLTIPQFKVYRNDKLGFTMNIPTQWEIVDKNFIKKLFASLNADPDPIPQDFTQEQMDAIMAATNISEGMIFADYGSFFWDNVVVSVDDEVDVLRSSESEIRLFIRAKYQGELEFNTEIYAIKRMNINGVPCVFIDLSHDPQRTRIHNFCFIRGNKAVYISLTAKLTTMRERISQFAKVIGSVKFHTP